VRRELIEKHPLKVWASGIAGEVRVFFRGFLRNYFVLNRNATKKPSGFTTGR
jgi:hypothetical protein